MKNNTTFAQQLDPKTDTYAIQYANIIDVKRGIVLPNQTIVISDGVIQSVTNSVDKNINNSITVIDGNGKYIMPGLFDMHAHLRGNKLPSWVSTDWMMPLFIANGVTGVREMTSSCDSSNDGPVCLDQMREWAEKIENGTLMGPRLLSLSSFQLNPPWNYDVTEKEARQLVQMFAEQNLDMVKIYYRLSPQAYSWVLDETKKQGLVAAGHIPLRMTVSQASRAGLRSLEHARDLLFDCFPSSAIFREKAISQDVPIDVLHDMVDQYDSEQCYDSFQVMIDHETWYVPTHVTRRMEAYADDSSFKNDPRNQYIPKWIMDAWNKDANRVVAVDSSDYGREAYMKFYKKGLEITGQAFQAGVHVLVGTDGGDSFSYPGFSVHDELQELVSAGMSPIQVIRAATISGAEFLGIENQYGTVEPGKKADLILLDKNPLTDVKNTQSINAVIFRGEYLDHQKLESLLEQVKNTASRPLFKK